MNSNVKNFLNNLQDINDANIITIKVPSTGKKSSFKLASVNQQKELLRTAFDGVDGVIKRATILNKLIIDNSVDDIDFLIIDKPAILIKLRSESIGSEIKIKDNTYDLNDLPEIDLKDIKLKATIQHEGITAKVKVPTLQLDIDINDKLAAELAKITLQEEKVKQSVDIVLAYETSKYIDSIKIGEDEIKFDDISSYERKEIVNNLPLKLNNKIIDYIGSLKQVTDAALTFSDEVMVEIDSSFLSAD